MSDRIYFKDGARITEEMLNDSFSFLEEAAQRLITSLSVRGVVRGLAVSPQPIADLSAVVLPGFAFDCCGQRICVSDAQTVDLSVASDGTPTAVVMPGHERWVALHVCFDRRPGKPFLDKNNRVVATCAVESFSFVVRAGIEATEGHAEKPVTSPGDVLLCDIRLVYGQSSVGAEDFDTSRRPPFCLTHARSIAADTLDGDGPPSSNVQEALQRVEARLRDQARLLQALVDGSGWETLPRAANLQTALDAVDGALTQHALALASLVTGDSWKYLPQVGTVQGALDAVDAALKEQTERLAETQSIVARLRTPSPREGTRTAFAFHAYDGHASIPTLGPNETYTFGIRAKGLKSSDEPVFAVTKEGGDRRYLLRPRRCAGETICVEFTNLTPRPTAASNIEFTVYVAEMD